MNNSESDVPFEQAMKSLEHIVSELERGDVPLEQAIDLFQKGMELSQMCSVKLDHVEHKIDMIIEKDGKLEKKPLQDVVEESCEVVE